MLVLAHETGHHIGATRQFWWSDIDPMPRTIRWRGKHEKIGDAPVMPATKDPLACMGCSLARDSWKKAERLAGLEPRWRRGWHSLGRKFASDLVDLQLICDVGGWKTAQTVLQCYQRTGKERLRKALEAYRQIGSGSNLAGTTCRNPTLRIPELIIGLGRLELPTSPLSGARCLVHIGDALDAFGNGPGGNGLLACTVHLLAACDPRGTRHDGGLSLPVDGGRRDRHGGSGDGDGKGQFGIVPGRRAGFRRSLLAEEAPVPEGGGEEELSGRGVRLVTKAPSAWGRALPRHSCAAPGCPLAGGLRRGDIARALGGPVRRQQFHPFREDRSER